MKKDSEIWWTIGAGICIIGGITAGAVIDSILAGVAIGLVFWLIIGVILLGSGRARN